MNFLDENGLGRLWAQIILKLNSKVPDGGTTGQVLKKTETGTERADAPQTVTIPETTALLKGDGAGGVAAVTTDATPTQGSTNPVQSGGVYTALGDKLDETGDGSNVTAAFTASSSRTNIATGEKLSVLFGKIAKWFSDLGSLAFKSTVAKTDLASAVQTSLDLADTALQSLPSHNHDASAIDSGILPVIRGGTGVDSLASLATALGAPKMEIVSYVGNGSYGSGNPTSVTFSFAPKLIAAMDVVAYINTSSQEIIPSSTRFINTSVITTAYESAAAPFGSSSICYGKKSSNGRTFTWYNDSSAMDQGNWRDYGYFVVAFG